MNELVEPALQLACSPTAILISSIVISAVQHKVGYDQSKADAASALQYQKDSGMQMLAADAANMSEKIARNNEDKNQGVRDRQAIERKAMVVSSQARTNALSNGVDGTTFDALMGEFHQRESELQHASYLQDDLSLNRYRREMAQSREFVASRLLSNYKPIHQPSAAAAMIGVAGDTAAAGGRYYAAKGTGDTSKPTSKPEAKV
jgi:hypothetical protein